jgi:hypothetical protein
MNPQVPLARALEALVAAFSMQQVSDYSVHEQTQMLHLYS